MSLCQEAYRRSASVALVLALVAIALPSLLNAQTAAPNAPAVQSADDFPKVELFIGYQWLNPGGNVPDQNGNAIKAPSLAGGFGTNVAYNFTKALALEANYGLNYSVHGSVNTVTVGPKLTWRGDGVDFFAHTLIGLQRLSPNGLNSVNGIAALLGGGIDLKLWKPVSLRLFEADFQWSHQNFASVVPSDDPSLRRPNYDGARLSTGIVLNF